MALTDLLFTMFLDLLFSGSFAFFLFLIIYLCYRNFNPGRKKSQDVQIGELYDDVAQIWHSIHWFKHEMSNARTPEKSDSKEGSNPSGSYFKKKW